MSGAGPKGLKGRKGLKGHKGFIGDKGPKGLKGPGTTCYQVNIEGPFFEVMPSCDPNPTIVYSNCSSLTTGCLIYEVPQCTSCTSLSGMFFHNFVDWWNTMGGNPCQLQLEGPCGRSDVRLKQGIETLTGVMDKLLQIEVKEYNWNEKLANYEQLKEKDKLHSIGIIAQELKEIYPELVFRRTDGYLTISYEKLNAILIEGVKEQQEMINEIDADIKYLKEKLS